ncbi:MAG: Lrp/AsnC ligand binding domain-containing protein [Rhodospirillales bacterium]
MQNNKAGNLDTFDRRILDVLAGDGRITITDLSQKVGLSKTPCQNRMRRLEKDGFIVGYRAVLDPARLGAGHIAFVQVTLSSTTSSALETFNAAAREVPEIEQCHMIAGGFDYLLKVRTSNIDSYRKILGERISGLPHVSHTSTFVVMESVVDLQVF